MENQTDATKKHRRRRRRHAQAEGGLTAPAAIHEVQQMMALSGFQGASYSSRRGFIFWPTTDTRQELDSYSFHEMLRKSRWLRANHGLPERICRGLADIVGFLTPIATTDDEEWNEEIEALWQDRAEEPVVFDAGGKFGARAMQLECTAAAFGDGDILPVIQSANDSGGLRMALYEAHQLQTPDYGDEAKLIFNGVKINKNGRHITYYLADPDTEKKYIAVNARDATYHAYFDRPGRVRPPTILCRAINHLLDITEITSDWKLGIKVAAQVGMYLKNTGTSGGIPRGFLTGLQDETNPVTKQDGTSGSQKYKVEEILNASGAVPNLPQGMDIGTIQDSRPHPNALELLKWLVREIAWGAGVSPELIWDIASLRGANNRVMTADLNRWIAAKLLTNRRTVKRWWTAFVAKEITAGRIREPRDPRWWKHTFIPQSSLTADKGREGQLNIDLVANGLRSLATHYGEMDGAYWLRELRQIAKERKTMKALGLDDVLASLNVRGGALQPPGSPPPNDAPAPAGSEPDLTD